MKTWKSRRSFLFAWSVLAAWGCSSTIGPSPPGPLPPFGIKYDLSEDNTTVWQKSDWSFDACGSQTGFLPDTKHVHFTSSHMDLVLDTNPNTNGTSQCPSQCKGKEFAGAEYRTRQEYGYGAYQVSMRAAKGCGVVTSFFIYDENERDEIDIEILGKDVSGNTLMQVNYFDNGKELHPMKVSLGFDASADFHDYRIEWSATEIRWLVRDKSTDPLVLKHVVQRAPQAPWPTNPGRVTMNLWAGCTTWSGCHNQQSNSVQCFSDQRAQASYRTVWLEPR